MPIVFSMLTQVPSNAPEHSAAVSATVTALVVCAIALKAKGILRLWAPVIGILIGTVVASYYGLYDFQKISDASWIGIQMDNGQALI